MSTIMRGNVSGWEAEEDIEEEDTVIDWIKDP